MWGFKLTRASDEFVPVSGSMYRSESAAKKACINALCRVALRGERHGELSARITHNGVTVKFLSTAGTWVD